ncbi:MAG: extracellular solute-binding protein [Christensenellales bacterium]|jgi:iron(III) transport system substrate-binding protein
MKKYFVTLLLLSMLLTALVPAMALGAAPASGKLMLYSSLPVAQLDLMVDMFNEKYPGITVDVFSAGSEDVFARARAEAGVAGGLVLGGSLEAFRSAQDLFTAYTTANAKALLNQYVAESAAFTPIQLHVSALVVNRDLAKELGVKVKGWESLKDERLSGRVAYMDPAASSPVSEQAAFVSNFARAANIASPSAPSFVLNAVTAGQYAVGIVNEEKAIERKMSGAKVDVVYAAEGVAMGASYAGILTGVENEETAKLFLDFITGREYQQAAADMLHQRSVRRDVDFGLKGIASTKNLKALDIESMALLTRMQTATR